MPTERERLPPLCHQTVGTERGAFFRKEGQHMAGRYQGHHRLRNGDFEVFWQQNGWFWRRVSSDCPPDDQAVGPFTTSTEAYQKARQRFTQSDAGRLPIAEKRS